MFETPDRRHLFLKRSGAGDHAGEWAFPGGKLESGETSSDAARRETIEETGYDPGPDGRREISRTKDGRVDYVTYHQPVEKAFEPKLNSEHTEAVWSTVDKAPSPLHPAVARLLRQTILPRADTAAPAENELDIARDIRDGKLPSPQRYQNISLYALRITGTGAAYREGLNEYVWRKPDVYLNDDFLERCQGLPVVMLHPEKNMLDHKEFRERVVGTIMLPYIKDDKKEVWGIAKIFDDDADRLMREKDLSTSPAVVFTEPGSMSKHRLEDGATLLIEGRPGLLDHLAICEVGVWDKGGEPAGVESSTQDHEGGSPVAENEKHETEDQKKAHEAKEHERGGMTDDDRKRLDYLIKKADAIHARLDSMEMGGEEAEGHQLEQEGDQLIEEGRRLEQEGDRMEHVGRGEMPAQAVADVRRARADAAAARQENAALRDRLASLESRLPAQLSDSDFALLASSQAAFDPVYTAFGDAVPRPMTGETPLAYRRRLAVGVQKHSGAWKDVELSSLPPAAFDIAEQQIRADAAVAARSPVSMPNGQLRQIIREDEVTGARRITFNGEPRAWMAQFMGAPRQVQRFVTNRKHGG